MRSSRTRRSSSICRGEPSPSHRPQGFRDLVDLGVGPGRHHHRLCAAADNAGAREDDGPSFGERRVNGVGQGDRGLRQRLAGEDGAVDQCTLAADHPRIGGDHVTAAQQQDVADHDFASRALERHAVAADARGRGGRGAQGLQCALGPISGDHVGRDDGDDAGEDQQAIARLTENHGEHASRDQDEDEWLGDGVP